MRSGYLCLFITMAVCPIITPAAELARIHGELACDNCVSYSNVVVEVTDQNHRPVGSFNVNSAGSFDISGISEGNYVMTVRGANGNEITSQRVSVYGETGPLSIRLPESEEKPTSKQASVSVYELSHQVPKSARKEFDKAVHAGDNHEAVIQHLKAALAIDPDYVAALNNLGSRYLQLNQYAEALTVLDHAQKLDPSSALVQTNIAVALLSLNKAEDAERAARRAHQLAGNDPRARYVLALSLYTKHD